MKEYVFKTIPWAKPCKALVIWCQGQNDPDVIVYSNYWKAENDRDGVHSWGMK